MKPAARMMVFLACLSWCLGEITTEPVLIQVVVTNETAGSPASDAEVALTIYQDSEPLDRRVGRSNAQGVCSFQEVPTGLGMAVVATAMNQDMMFSSRPMSLEHAHDAMYQLEIVVYDVSTDTSALSIGTHHLVVRVAPQGLFIDEYLQVINDSDKAVTSEEKTPEGKPAVLKVYLPAGFKDIIYSKYFQEQALIMTDDGFIDTMAVPPGRHDAVFTYAVKTETPSVQIIKKAALPTQDLMVFSQLSGASIAGLDEPLGQMTINNGSPADYFPSVSLETGDQISFEITGLSIAQDPDDLWIMFGVIFGVMILIGIVRTWTHKKQSVSASDKEGQ
ncbi:MAG: hypothetical protein ACYSOQ_02590 [Planctomycetota bacterium]|jgi:hypothetical protein